MSVEAPTARDLFRTAGRLARTGQPVFPCKSTGTKAKAPLTHNGLYDASTDIDQIRSWWRQHRTAAVGIPTGIVWDVLDVDVKNGQDGRVHLPRLNELGLLDGCQKVVRTPSGGWHLYFQPAPALGLTNKAKRGLGLDVRSNGGYVLAAGSFIQTEEYAGYYEDVGTPANYTNDPLLWDLIMSVLEPVDVTTKKPITLLPSERQSSIGALREFVYRLLPGERNNGLHWAVCRCIENGLDPNELAEAAIGNGLDEDEVMLTINSALRRAGVNVKELATEAEALFPEDD